MHACPHVPPLYPFEMPTPAISTHPGPHLHTQKPTRRQGERRVFCIAPLCSALGLCSVSVLLTFTNFIFNWLSTRTRSRAWLTTSNWAYEMPERTWALTKSFTSRPGHDTHTHIYTPKRYQRKIQRKEDNFSFVFSLWFCFVLKNPFLSFQFRCQLPSVLYYLFYFKRKEHERECVWVVGYCALCKPSQPSILVPYPQESFRRNYATHNSFANRNSLICCFCVCAVWQGYAWPVYKVFERTRIHTHTFFFPLAIHTHTRKVFFMGILH